MIFLKSRNLQYQNLLRDKLRAKMVIRATALSNCLIVFLDGRATGERTAYGEDSGSRAINRKGKHKELQPSDPNNVGSVFYGRKLPGCSFCSFST